MRTFLRSLAFPAACAFTGAAAALLVTHLSAGPASTCPDAPVLEIHPHVAYAPPAPQLTPPPPPPPAPALAPLPDPFAIPEGAVRCANEGRCSIDRVFFATLLDNIGLLRSHARVMPSIRDGDMRGFKFYGLRPGSLFRQLGFKNGDLLTAVNGVRLTSMGDLAALSAPIAPGTYVLDIERKGEPVQLRVGID